MGGAYRVSQAIGNDPAKPWWTGVSKETRQSPPMRPTLEFHRGFLALLAAAILGLSQQSCVGPTFVVQQYSGPQRPAQTIATLRLYGTDRTRLVSFDDGAADAPIAEDARVHIEILPGEHRITVANAAHPEEPTQRMAFHAEPGKFYRVGFTPRDASTDAMLSERAHVYEIDPASDALLRDVTRPDQNL